MTSDLLAELPPKAFEVRSARIVTHIDEGAVAALTGIYRRVLSESGRLLTTVF